MRLLSSQKIEDEYFYFLSCLGPDPGKKYFFLGPGYFFFLLGYFSGTIRRVFLHTKPKTTHFWGFGNRSVRP